MEQKRTSKILVAINAILNIAIVGVVFIIIMLLLLTKESYVRMEYQPYERVMEEVVQEPISNMIYNFDDITAERDDIFVTQKNTAKYIFEDSDVRYLTEEEVGKLSRDDMRIARNEIYARRGRIFEDKELSDYFNSMTWYVPKYTGEEMDQKYYEIFNKYEQANIELISRVEDME